MKVKDLKFYENTVYDETGEPIKTVSVDISELIIQLTILRTMMNLDIPKSKQALTLFIKDLKRL